MTNDNPPRLSRYRRPAEPAWDDFSWRAWNSEPLTLRRLHSILGQAEADGVPGDAIAQWSGADLYFNWRRPA